MKCERCGKETDTYRCSWFNKESICPDCCEVESRHPMFKEAKEKEMQAVQNGDYNFPGIGLPEDFASFVEQLNSVIYEIFQPIEKERASSPLFCSWDYCVENKILVVPSVYHSVYKGNIRNEKDDSRTLEQIYFLFNAEHPAGFKGHSLSMGDVVRLGERYFYTDRIGFKEIPFTTVNISVYRDTVDNVQDEDDTNIAEIRVSKEFALSYWKERKSSDSDKGFEWWLQTYTCDDTQDFYEYALEHAAVLNVNRW